MREQIRTSRQAIDALGGATKVAAMFADVAPRTVWNWRKRGINPRAWLVLARPLRRIGRFSPRIFDMLEPRRR